MRLTEAHQGLLPIYPNKLREVERGWAGLKCSTFRTPSSGPNARASNSRQASFRMQSRSQLRIYPREGHTSRNKSCGPLAVLPPCGSWQPHSCSADSSERGPERFGDNLFMPTMPHLRRPRHAMDSVLAPNTRPTPPLGHTDIGQTTSPRCSSTNLDSNTHQATVQEPPLAVSQ
jgi:hypothetical protein